MRSCGRYGTVSLYLLGLISFGAYLENWRIDIPCDRVCREALPGLLFRHLRIFRQYDELHGLRRVFNGKAEKEVVMDFSFCRDGD